MLPAQRPRAATDLGTRSRGERSLPRRHTASNTASKRPNTSVPADDFASA
jgi:hypothetical protein